jgi:glycosyltransferase involved in cell wall biosynthesis
MTLQTRSHAADAGRLSGLRVGVAAISLSGGGAERSAATWAAAAAEQGADVSFFAIEPAEEQFALPAGVPLTVAGKRGRRDTIRIIAALRRFAADLDVVAAFQPYVGVLCAHARLGCNWVLVTGQDPRHRRDTSRLPSLLVRRAIRSAGAAVAPSRGLIACHEQLRLRPRNGWRHVPNIVPDEAFIATAAPRDGVLFVGRLVPEKRPLLALAAAAAARLPITFLGDGPLRSSVLSEAARLGVSDMVSLRGFSAEPWSVYSEHRVLVLTSRYETFANVLVESLAAGTPVVSVDCDFGPREIVGDARFSALVPESIAAVTAALETVHGRSRSQAEAEECRSIARRYRREAIAPTIADVLRECA